MDPQRRWVKAVVVDPNVKQPLIVRLLGAHFLRVKLEEGYPLDPDGQLTAGTVVEVGAVRVRPRTTS